VTGRLSEGAKAVSMVVKTTVDVPADVLLAAKNLPRFVARSADDAGLLRQELALQRQIASAEPLNTASNVRGGVVRQNRFGCKRAPNPV
jgi:hypothetical protein